MKKTIWIILILTITQNTWGQCDLLMTASIADCQKNYSLTLSSLMKFRQDFPNHALIEEVNQKIGHLYYLTGDIQAAKVELEKLLKGHNSGQDNNDYNALECETNYDNDDFYCMRIIFPEPYTHLQHWAALDLHDIYKEQGDFKAALSYLKDADKKYVFNYWCGNGNMMKSIQIALLYADLYKKMDKPHLALEELLNYSFENYLSDNTEAINKSIEIIIENYNITDIRLKLDTAIDNIEREEKVYDDNTYINYFITFLDIKIRVIYPNWGDKAYKTEDIKELLKNTAFYKQINE